MSSSLRMPLVVVGLLSLFVTLALLFFFVVDDLDRSATTDAGRSAVTEPVEDQQELTAADEPALVTELSAEESAARQSLQTEQPEAYGEHAWPEEESQWVEGRVFLPAGTPTSETPFVLALSGARSLPALYRSPSPVDAFWDPDEEHHALLSSAAVDEKGNFRIALPPDAEKANLAVVGRFVYSRATTAVSLSSSESPTLIATLGGLLTGRLIAPEDATEEQRDFTYVDVELGPDVTASIDAMALSSTITTRSTEANADGTFELRAIPAGAVHGILVKPDGLAAYVELGIVTQPGEALELAVRLLHGAVLSGDVRDEDGEPIEGAKIAVRYRGPLGDAIGKMSRGETDVDGRFVLENVPAMPIELVAKKDGYRDGKLKPDEPREGERVEGLELVLAEGTAVIGHVRFPGGAPAVGAIVNMGVSFSELGGLSGFGLDLTDGGRTETDEDGSFRISGLGDGTFVVTASFETEEGIEWNAREDGVRGDGEPVEIELSRMGGIGGRVVDEEGEPIADFVVSTILKGSGAIFDIGAERNRVPFEAAEDGHFEIGGLRPGTWKVVADAEGYSESDTIEVELVEGIELVTITLQAASRVSGTVLDTSDSPVAGAKITPEVDVAARIGYQFSGGIPQAITDMRGRFELGELSPGSMSLVATLEGFAGSEPVSCELVSGELTEGVVLRLRVGGVLTGQVLDDEGEPDEGKMITIQRVPSYAEQRITQSDANGEFRFEHLEAGEWQVIATLNYMSGEADPSDGEPGEAMAELLGNMKLEMAHIIDGEETHVVLGVLPSDPVVIDGRVEHAGEGVPGAVVTFMSDEASGLAALKIAIAGDDGGFQTELDHPGTYLVTVQNVLGSGRQNSIEFLERIPEVETHGLTLELPLGRISGTVRGPDGNPMPACRITLNVEGGVAYGSFFGGHYSELVTDDEGRYDVRYLSRGTYSVAAGGPDLGGLFGASGDAGRSVQSGLVVKEDQWLDGIDFRLELPGDLAGVVTAPDGSPVADATIFVRNADGGLLERFSLITTDGAGRFAYKGLAPGEYSVSARSADRASSESDIVRVDSGERTDTAITVDRATILRVTIVDRSDDEVRARISVVDSEGREHNGLMSMSEIMERLGSGFSGKEQRVGPLPPGTYHIVATADDGRTTRKKLTLKGQAERKLKLRLR